jgi:hypothetical protein
MSRLHGFRRRPGDLSLLKKSDTTFVVISRAPLVKLDPYKAQKEWDIQWYSSFGNDFNYDFHVTLDWGHVDAKTDKPRELQVDRAMDCIDFEEGPVGRVTPVVESTTPVQREQLLDCEYFRLWRLGGELPFSVGAMGLPRVLVCIEGGGEIEQGDATYAVGKGDVLFLPAVVGPCTLWPRGAVNLLEIALPE